MKLSYSSKFIKIPSFFLTNMIPSPFVNSYHIIKVMNKTLGLKKTIRVIAGQIVANYLSIEALHYTEKLTKSSLQNSLEEYTKKGSLSPTSIMISLGGYILGDFIYNVVKKIAERSQIITIQEGIEKHILEGNMVTKITTLNDSKLNENLALTLRDSKHLAEAISLTTDGLNKIFLTCSAAYNIYKISAAVNFGAFVVPDILALALCSNLAFALVNLLPTKIYEYYKDKQKRYKTESDRLTTQMIVDSHRFSVKEAFEYIARRAIEVNRKYSYFDSFRIVCNKFSDSLDIGLKILNESIIKNIVDIRAKSLALGNVSYVDFSSYFKWMFKSGSKMAKYLQSTKRIENITDIIDVLKSMESKITYKDSSNEDITINLTKFYKMRNVNLTFQKGKVYAITGNSGLGKSTLMETLLRLNLRISTITEKRELPEGVICLPKGKKISMMLQNSLTFKGVSIFESICACAGMNEIDENRRVEVRNLITRLGFNHEFLTNFDNNIPIENLDYLSGGEKKKLSIISEIIKNPDILILDEPFNELDNMSQKEVQNILKEYFADKTLVIIDHDANLEDRHTSLSKEVIHYDFNKFLCQESTPTIPMAAASLKSTYTSCERMQPSMIPSIK